jgi:vacuolar-type H+-ATPase subunit F/Vma7
MGLRSTHILLLALVAIVVIGVIVNAIIMSQKPSVRPPDIELLVTGKMRGRFELCGCPGERLQSLPIRASVIRQLLNNTERRKRLILVESGEFVGDRESVEVAMRSFKMLGYDIVAVAEGERRYIDEVSSYAKTLGTKLIARDACPTGTSETCKPSWVIKRQNFTVAFVTTGVQPQKKAVDEKWKEVERDIEAVAKEANAVILINHWQLKELERVLKVSDAKKHITLVINHDTPETQRENKLERRFGVYMLMLTDVLQPMPIVNIWLRRGKASVVRLTQLAVPSASPPDEKVEKLVSSYYRERQKRLREEWSSLVRRVKRKEYMSPKECSKCHEAQYRQWLTTKHAKAILTLVEKNRVEPECLQCHSEEFRQTKLLTNVSEGYGVECVSCHLELKDPIKVKEHGQMPSERARPPRVDPKRVCTTCHNKEHSPKFEGELSDYMMKVRH